MHIFDHELLLQTVEKLSCPVEMLSLRPVLRLVVSREDRLEPAIKGEMEFWHRLDRVRMKVHERAVRSYMVAVKRDPRSDSPQLAVQHQCRLEHAECLLPANPLREYSLDRLIAEAQAEAAKFAPAGSLEWLPDVRGSFIGLAE